MTCIVKSGVASTTWKVSKYGVFSGPNTDQKKTPYLETSQIFLPNLFDYSNVSYHNYHKKRPYIYDIHEKYPILAPPPPPLILFSVCPNGSESDKTPRRSWTSTLRLPTTPIPISFGILAKNCIGKSPKYTQCKAVICNEKRHVKSSNMSTVLIRLLQIIRNYSKQESVYVFNLYFCSSVFVSELILIVIISIQLNECWISKQFEDVDDRSCNFTGTCFFLYNLSPIHYHTRHYYCDRPDTSLEHL